MNRNPNNKFSSLRVALFAGFSDKTDRTGGRRHHHNYFKSGPKLLSPEKDQQI